MNWNKTEIAGNLTRDPELRFSPKGTAVCKIGIAVNRYWQTESGEKKEAVDFIDVDCFGKQAETIAKHCKKGSNLFVAGRLQLDTWEKDGQKHSKLKVVLEQFQFCGGKSDQPSAGSGGYSSGRSSAPVPSTPPPTEPDMPPAESDEPPF